MEDQPPRRSRRLQNLPPLLAVKPMPPPQRKGLDNNGSFESTSVSEILGEMELRYTQIDISLV